jgi:hypothetical protein
VAGPPKIFIETLLQYNDRSDKLSSNWRFGWLQTANNGLFIVYNETSEIGGSDLTRDDRSWIAKYSRVFDLLN